MKKAIYSIIVIITVFIMTSATNIIKATENELENQNFIDAISNKGVATVNGITYNPDTSAFTIASGTYTLKDNISLNTPITIEAGNTVTINLNGKNIKAATSELGEGVIINKGNLTITGNGAISGYEEVADWGTTQMPTLNNDSGTATISGGTFNGHIYVKNGSTATIKSGTFSAKSNDAIYVLDGSTVNISGGTFTSNGASGLISENWESENAINTINISGNSTFTGASAGLWVNTTDSVKLAGGTYKGTEIGGIVTFKEDAFNGFLSSKYKYSEELKVTKNSIYSAYGTQSVISVVAITNSSDSINTTPTENTNSTPTENTNNTPSENVKEEKTFEEAAKEEAKSLINKIIAGKEVEGIDDELAAKIKKANEDEKDIEVKVVLPEVKAEDVKEDAEKVKNFIATDSKVAAYFDIEILVTIDGEVAGNITVLGQKIKVTIPMPTNLPEIPEGYTRTYTVIRVHNGVATELDAEVAGDNVSFESNEFSIYALAYTDVVAAEEEGASETSEETNQEETTNTTSNPKTGDNIMFYVITLAIAVVGGSLLIKRAKMI